MFVCKKEGRKKTRFVCLCVDDQENCCLYEKFRDWVHAEFFEKFKTSDHSNL